MKNLFTVRVQKSEIFYFLTLLTLPIIALLLPIEELQNYSYVLYFAQQILFFRIFLKYRYIFLLMTPIMLILFYINISFGIASFAYVNNFVYEKGDLAGFYNWQHLNFTTFYVLTSSSILFFTNYLLKSQFTKILNIQKKIIAVILENI